MTRLQVKICGITCPTQAQQLLALGVDNLGLILHPASPRAITPDALPRFTSLAKHLVPVVVEQDHQAMQTILNQTHAIHIQLHGATPKQTHHRLADHIQRFFALDARHPLPNFHTLTTRYHLNPERDKLVIDSTQSLPITHIAQLIHSIKPFSCFIAGRLTAQRIKALRATCSPFGVDLASSVEVRPGIKHIPSIQTIVQHCQRTL